MTVEELEQELLLSAELRRQLLKDLARAVDLASKYKELCESADAMVERARHELLAVMPVVVAVRNCKLTLANGNQAAFKSALSLLMMALGEYEKKRVTLS